ncbi:hypothetical protein CLUG_05024 [Clavispora lusitaniae ATCC 42720]|uniref:Phosphomevalonate kinase n=1 Tax=Clavispora lusitaniae (strain ATCC 42720) TaxID=306902 RepID=C4YA86_CLAL4|nr:uncharacterized protein CLUG_05024 [Clavispora lusitaniae ATCC 42720]EEQ40896.1 hypothetical protein CLUG_05024 [Clavispora lusitaniae ATCC 42720]KAF5209237.1 phosphomevalonate kinase [Clavispora lusitaniae]
MAQVFSAPGKALVAGGYLVLDPAYNAYVTALSSRMHAVIEDSTVSDISRVSISSPQFGGKWEYLIEGCHVRESQNQNNPFLASAIRCAVAYAAPSAPFSATITLFSDPGYHTQENTTRHTSDGCKKTFLYHTAPVEHVPKTGMGSSAGLVTVVTAALLARLTGRPLAELREVVHNVAQVAHCAAQGKVGSGFDVAAAVFGSIVYRRFPPSTIAPLLEADDSVFPNLIRQCADATWNFDHIACALPAGIRLIMGDVNGGSETPRLVAKVLSWRSSDAASAGVYSSLDAANNSFVAALEHLHSQYRDGEKAYWENFERNVQPVAAALGRIRAGLQQLTASSGAEVEPPEQTVLLDQCTELPGCLGGVVPGAGGYDAVCLLVEEQKLQEFSEAAKSLPVTWLDLAEEAEGLIEGNPADYAGLPR